jgi:uncharacterized integral membrane protein
MPIVGSVPANGPAVNRRDAGGAGLVRTGLALAAAMVSVRLNLNLPLLFSHASQARTQI